MTKRTGSDKSTWREVGALWPNGDGKGFNMKLDCIPLNGADLVIREKAPDDETASA